MTLALVKPEERHLAKDEPEIDLALLKRTICQGATDDEFALFAAQCKRSGLDPFSRQIHFVKRQGRMVIQTGIDGFRLIADRTGQYAGNDDPVFDDEESPTKATVTVWKLVNGQRVPFTASARWSQYYPGDQQGFMWRKMPHLMLGKCAEGLALRKAFPQELSGLYTDDEMDQANSTPAPGKIEPSKPTKSTVTIETFTRELEEATNLIELASAWNAVPAKFQKALVSLKEERKAKLVTPWAEPEPKQDKDAEEREQQIQRLIRVIAARPPLNFSKAFQRFGKRAMGLSSKDIAPVNFPKIDSLTVGQAQQFADLIETNIEIPQSELEKGDAWEPDMDISSIAK